jgi:hypothetical protein
MPSPLVILEKRSAPRVPGVLKERLANPSTAVSSRRTGQIVRGRVRRVTFAQTAATRSGRVVGF